MAPTDNRHSKNAEMNTVTATRNTMSATSALSVTSRPQEALTWLTLMSLAAIGFPLIGIFGPSDEAIAFSSVLMLACGRIEVLTTNCADEPLPACWMDSVGTPDFVTAVWTC